MNVARRALTGTLAALLLALTGPALSAHATGYHFTSLWWSNGGALQACRYPTVSTKPFTIKVRVNAKLARSRVNGTSYATRQGATLGTVWHSGWVARGQLSSVGTVHVPRGTAYRLSGGIGTGQMGNGGAAKPLNIPAC